jgi:LmbE family N-acetylglucosaminyl deacetylase
VTVIVLSPHFDDAVLSCGGWLARHAGATVATVCSGRPGPGVPADPNWDALARFADADQAAEARRSEDRAALDQLGAEQVLLGFLDGSYKERVDRAHEDRSVVGGFEEVLTDRLGQLLDERSPEWCLFPLGLLHPDHVVTRRAAVSSLAARPAIRAMSYLDLPYGIAFEEAARAGAEAMPGRLDAEHPPETVTAEVLADTRGRKRLATGSYRSQLPLLRQSFGPALEASLEPGAECLRAWRP